MLVSSGKKHRFSPFFKKYWHHENNYTLKKGKTCNEKSFSCDAHPDAGLSFQMQLLLEFRGRIPDHEHRDHQGSGGMAQKFP
jgi:hypothetical protein